jgi:hypothetical protein
MKAKDILFLSPEIYLIFATIYYWILSPNLFNPIAVVLLAILTYQIIYKNSSIGLVISSLFLVLNLYLVLALISELHEFTEVNDGFIKLILIGSIFLGLNIIVSIIMLIKYINIKDKKATSEKKTVW